MGAVEDNTAARLPANPLAHVDEKMIKLPAITVSAGIAVFWYIYAQAK